MFFFFHVKHTFHNKNENVFIFKRNMLILIDTSKITIFFKVFLPVPGKLIKY